MIDEVLRNLDLSDEEAELYLALIEEGTQTAQQLAKSTSIKRTYVYRIANQLLVKGLVSIERSGRSTSFSPKSPDHLLSLAQEKKEKAQEAERNLERVIDNLKLQYQNVDAKPLVKVYEGVEGLKKIYLDTLKVGKEISAVVETSEMDTDLREWLKTEYIHKRAAAKIHAKVILSSGKLSGEYQTRNKIAYRTVVEVPSQRFPIKHEVDIYGDKVAFIKYHKSEPLVGLVIENKIIAQTMKAWFDLSWEGALKVNKS